ncbi:MAG: ECF-type sigma factor [Longimicrobiales bacterium]
MAESGPEQKREHVERLLNELRDGDESAYERLIPFVYQELREIAHRHRTRWTGNETMGTTVLVHEAYMKLAAQGSRSWEHHSHFLAVASRAMRQVLIDYARRGKAGKRGGEAERISLDQVSELLGAFPEFTPSGGERLLALDESLKRLEGESSQHCRIVECRFFGDMTIEETARALGISPATVKRGWVRASAWLHRDMGAAGAQA